MNEEKSGEKKVQNKETKHFSLKGVLELERNINKTPRKS